LEGERCVLIVDPSPETREVLQVALQRRGLHTLATARVRRGMELARRHQPDLIVLDLDIQPGDSAGLSRQFAEQAGRHEPRMILLGSARRAGESSREVLSKPYDFRALIRKIEELVQAVPSPARRSD